MKTKHVVERVVFAEEPDAVIHLFAEPGKMLDYAYTYRSQIAFISMEAGGFFEAKKLKAILPRVNIIATGSQYRFARELMDMRVSGYIQGEFTDDKVVDELNDLRYKEVYE